MTATRVIDRPALRVYAKLVAGCTFLLLLAGGMVTSTGSGLAVPDWPLSFGKVMPAMEGGVLYEHGHRMVATFVGALIVVEALWLWRAEPRGWVRRLGWLALAGVIVQGALGGLTVLLGLPDPVSVAHAGLAEIVFGLTVTIALARSRGWIAKPATALDSRPAPSRWPPSPAWRSYAQILLGALCCMPAPVWRYPPSRCLCRLVPPPIVPCRDPFRPSSARWCRAPGAWVAARWPATGVRSPGRRPRSWGLVPSDRVG